MPHSQRLFERPDTRHCAAGRDASAVANPSAHAELAGLPFLERLEDWDLDRMHGVLGLHRHVVRLIELDDVTYVVKELPDALVEREYRLLRELADDGLPTAEVVAALTGKPDGVDGMLVTRHIDYSLPYRTLLAGRGLTIPYLGDRVLDALGRSARPAPPRRLLLGRLFTVEHAVPPRRRRAVGVRHRHRDRCPLSGADRRAAPARSRHRHRERGRRSARPADGRPARRRHRPVGGVGPDRTPLRVTVDRAHRAGRVRQPTRRSGSSNGSSGCTNSATTSRRWRSSAHPTATGSGTSHASSSTGSTPSG